jgi:hypothetical protein
MERILQFGFFFVLLINHKLMFRSHKLCVVCYVMKRSFTILRLKILLENFFLFHYTLPPKLKQMDWTSLKPFHLH